MTHPSLDHALSTWRALFQPPEKRADEWCLPSDLEETLDVLLTQGKIDSPALYSKVLGAHSGMCLLSAVLWNFGRGSIEEHDALVALGALLDKGADTQAVLNGMLSVEVLVCALRISESAAPRALGVADLMVRAGMNANTLPPTERAQLIETVASLSQSERLTQCLFEGPLAVELDQATHPVSKSPTRRMI